MNLNKRLKDTNYETLRDLQISLLIHFFVLILLTLYFAYNNKEDVKKNKISVPVKLVAPTNKPKLGSGTAVKPAVGAKKSEGLSDKLVKPAEKKIEKPIQKEVKKEEIKHVEPVTEKKAKQQDKPKQQEKTISKDLKEKSKTEKKTNSVNNTKKNKVQTTVKKNLSKNSNNKSHVMPQKAKETAKQAVVQNDEKVKPAIIKPSHTKPIFEEKGDIFVTPTMNTELLSETSDSMLSVEPQNMFEPSSNFNNDLPESIPESIEQEKTGVQEKSEGEAGLFEIGAIEAFGGSNETFSPPLILRRVMPEYPEWARKKGVHGSAVYRVLILPSGTVGEVFTMSSTIDPSLALTGSQALRRWVFSPVLINGEPQETWVKITVQYELN